MKNTPGDSVSNALPTASPSVRDVMEAVVDLFYWQKEGAFPARAALKNIPQLHLHTKLVSDAPDKETAVTNVLVLRAKDMAKAGINIAGLIKVAPGTPAQAVKDPAGETEKLNAIAHDIAIMHDWLVGITPQDTLNASLSHEQSQKIDSNLTPGHYATLRDADFLPELQSRVMQLGEMLQQDNQAFQQRVALSTKKPIEVAEGAKAQQPRSKYKSKDPLKPLRAGAAQAPVAMS